MLRGVIVYHPYVLIDEVHWLAVVMVIEYEQGKDGKNNKEGNEHFRDEEEVLLLLVPHQPE